VLPDFLIFGKPAGLQFRENTLSIDAYFETAAVRRYQHQPLDLIFEIRDEFFGQTDRFRFVISNLAIDDFDFHYVIFLVWFLP
jgi:hypothetical protein